MTSGKFHAQITKTVKRCNFPKKEAEERAIRDVLFLGMNSTRARDKAINVMSEENKELTTEFLMQHLEIEVLNSHHKSLSHLDSTVSVNFVPCDHRQNKGSKGKKNSRKGKQTGQKPHGHPKSSNSGHNSRKPPGMEGKCMRYGKHEHWQGQKCPAKDAKCKACHKIGHFHKVCMTTRRQQWGRMVANIQINPRDTETYEDELGATQPCPPKVNMIKVINHLQYQGMFSEGKHLKFKVASHPSRLYDDHLVVRVDTGADVNCMNEITYKELFPEVKLSVCPDEIQNFRNSNCRHFYTRTPHNGRTSVMRNPLSKQDILSHYSGCFEGIGQFPGEPYKFHLKPEHKPARHAPRKVSVHL